MVEEHVLDLRNIVSRVSGRVARLDAVECKRFFGGAAAYVDGRIFMTLTSVGLALKLPQRDRASLMAMGGKPLRYFPQAPVKKEYVVTPRAIAADEVALAPWIGKSVIFVTGQGVK